MNDPFSVHTIVKKGGKKERKKEKYKRPDLVLVEKKTFHEIR